ncbi:unnamed protein product [Echinostoma caproni]|uniref:MFS domain-containing protein n=1 Tax=Echinostoma caproni TaxID=27848 RepID=A0A183AHZ5_9TREM|nr:unnamed protein product [Echinostoma caproni]
MACGGSGITPMLILTVFITCFGSSFVIGYNSGVVNLPSDHIKKFLSDNVSGKVSTSFLYALVSAVFVVAGAAGSFSSGAIAESLGRRNTLLINHIFSIVGAVLSGPCVVAKSPALLYVGRIVTGFNAGISLGVTSMYLTEVSPQDIRGAIGACHQLAVTIGIMMSYILTLDKILNTDRFWPLAMGLAAVPATISLFILPICPESPRFLFMKKGKEFEARKAFVKLNSKEDPDVFINGLKEEMEAAAKQPKFKFIQICTRKDLRMPILLACLIQVQQQLSGINAVISYSSVMLATSGLEADKIQYCVVGIGVFNVIVTIISLPLLERAGRRPLLLWPAVMFRQEPRAAAYALSQGIQWLSNLLVLISYPSINDAIKGYSFLPFLVIVVACWIVFFLFLPETKNRTFDDVANELSYPHVVIGKRSKTSEMEIFSKGLSIADEQYDA